MEIESHVESKGRHIRGAPYYCPWCFVREIVDSDDDDDAPIARYPTQSRRGACATHWVKEKWKIRNVPVRSLFLKVGLGKLFSVLM